MSLTPIHTAVDDDDVHSQHDEDATFDNQSVLDNNNYPGNHNSDSEEEEVNEKEPKLKYERIGNNLKTILSRDAASTIAVHTKFLCIGSHWGIIYLLDHMGNSVLNQELKSHAVVVNQISIDSRGDYIASCSDDGRVVINNLSSDEKPLVFNFDHRVKAIAIDPNYNCNGSRRFITGDTRLMIHELAIFNRLKSNVLSASEGVVHNISWRGQFLAWATDVGVRLYKLDEPNPYKRNIGLIRKDHDSALRTELYPCHLCWKNNSVLLVAWADTVKVCSIARRTELKENYSHLCIEIMYMFVTDFFIAGIGPLENNLVLLGYCKELDKNTGKPQRPQIHIVEPEVEDYTEISRDILSIRGFEEYRCSDYHFVSLIEENIFFVTSLKDIVVARTRDCDDHVQWLIQHAMFQEAMEKVLECKKELKYHTFLQVGHVYLDYLLKSSRFDEAGSLCVRLCGKDRKLWEDEVFKFVQFEQLRAVSPYIPTEECQLEQYLYEMVLFEFLRLDLNGFLVLVRKWSPSLYNVTAITNAVIEHLLANNVNNPILLRALATLYTYSKKYDKAMAMYLRLNDEDVFELIRKHHLFDNVCNQALELIQLNYAKAISLFLDHTAQITPESVIGKLKDTQKYMYYYLDALYKKESKNLDRKYHGELVKLYATYDQSKLLPFLRSSDQYPIQEAMDICEYHELIPERVYLLGRMGNTQTALELITEKLMDIDQAVEFCKEHDDPELWTWLINFSLDKPQFINVLLQNIGTHVDPQILIRKITNGLQIPGLRDSLAKIMHDYNLQISLQEGYKKILVSDCANLMVKLTKSHLRGLGIDIDQQCESCHIRIISHHHNTSVHFIIFNCKHCYHEKCLELLTSNVVCCLCHPKN